LLIGTRCPVTNNTGGKKGGEKSKIILETKDKKRLDAKWGSKTGKKALMGGLYCVGRQCGQSIFFAMILFIRKKKRKSQRETEKRIGRNRGGGEKGKLQCLGGVLTRGALRWV